MLLVVGSRPTHQHRRPTTSQVDNEQGTQLTDPADAPTPVGNAQPQSGKADPTVSGLNAALNKALAEKRAAEAKVAELTPIAEEHRTTRRENAILRKKDQYRDVAPVLDTLFARDFDPDKIDDDFVAALRQGAGAPPREDFETPTLNTPRTTRTSTPEDQMKKITPEEFWGES